MFPSFKILFDAPKRMRSSSYHLELLAGKLTCARVSPSFAWGASLKGFSSSEDPKLHGDVGPPAAFDSEIVRAYGASFGRSSREMALLREEAVRPAGAP